MCRLIDVQFPFRQNFPKKDRKKTRNYKPVGRSDADVDDDDGGDGVVWHATFGIKQKTTFYLICTFANALYANNVWSDGGVASMSEFPLWILHIVRVVAISRCRQCAFGLKKIRTRQAFHCHFTSHNLTWHPIDNY